MSFKILDRYIFKQVLTATIMGIFLFIVVWISPEILFKIIKRFINGDISFILAVKLFFLEIPEILSKAIPVGLMIGCLFVFDRLSKDSELTIIRVAGVSVGRLILPVLFLSIIGMSVCLFIYKDIIPYTTTEIKRLKGDIFQHHFVYIDKKEDKQPKQILIVGGFDGKNIYDVKLLRFSGQVKIDTPLLKSIITSEKAKIFDNHWSLIKATQYEIAPSGVYQEIKKFDTLDIFDAKSAKEAEQLLVYSTKRPREMKNKDLKDYIGLLKSLDMPDEYRFTLSKYYQRFSHSAGCIFLAICGVLLGISKPREKRFLGFTAGAALIFVYYILVPFLDMMAQTGALPSIIAAWGPNIIVLAVIGILIKYRNV
ncbi:MAG: hypothetical protein A2104_07240 [Candidatus Melainabacteria bacterium GWF2_32_7]|nr:MAG: hypothetical protein A2104_07240 [Candidatus Melainabacteria bacterium GWF2_32_7]